MLMSPAFPMPSETTLVVMLLGSLVTGVPIKDTSVVPAMLIVLAILRLISPLSAVPSTTLRIEAPLVILKFCAVMLVEAMLPPVFSNNAF